jgi:hypothetical protein
VRAMRAMRAMAQPPPQERRGHRWSTPTRPSRDRARRRRRRLRSSGIPGGLRPVHTLSVATLAGCAPLPLDSPARQLPDDRVDWPPRQPYDYPTGTPATLVRTGHRGGDSHDLPAF